MNHDPAYWPRKAEQYAAERKAALARVAELETVASAAWAVLDVGGTQLAAIMPSSTGGLRAALKAAGVDVSRLPG